MKWIILFFLSFFALLQTSYSGGFQLSDHNARSIGMGFSSIANISDASAIFYNPAGITFDNSNLDVILGCSYIMPNGKFTGITSMNEQKTTSLETWNFALPNFFAAWKTPVEGLSVGAGVFIPFGLGTRWPSNWVGRFAALETYLQTVEINPNIAYQFKVANMPVSLAAGFGYVIGNVELSRKLSTFEPEPTLQLKGKGNATTFNGGLMIEPMKSLRIGASYRHNIKIEFDGDVTYQDISGLEPIFVPCKGKTTLNLPNDFRLGVAYELVNNLWLEASMAYTGWSSYDTLALTFDKRPGAPTQTNYTITDARLYKNSFAYRLGGEYKYNENLYLRAGVYYDQMPVNPVNVEPSLPEGNKIGGSLGLGYKINNMLSFDFAYLATVAQQTEVINSPVGFDGLYNSYASLLSLSLNLHF